jgi:hypothetical protein
MPVPIGRTSSGCGIDVSVHRDGDVVREIEVRCKCGERIVLECTPG